MQNKNSATNIEFEFYIEDGENASAFTLANGFEVGELNNRITADLTDNVLIIELMKRSDARAFVDALQDNILSLSIADMQFKLVKGSAMYSIDEKMALVVKIEVDPNSAKLLKRGT